MKARHILFFFLAVFLLLGVVWRFYPKDGIRVGEAVLRFPSYEQYLSDLRDSVSGLDLDRLLSEVNDNYEIPDSTKDTLNYFSFFIQNDPNRIYLPQDDYTFFDSLFVELDSAATAGKTVRIMHYGDSQLEMDRISANLREALQGRFGGSGPGMVPMIQRIPTVSLSQWFSGGVTRYAMVGDSLTRKASHHRYGPLTQMCTVYGHSTFSFRRTKNRYAQQRSRSISRVSVLMGQFNPGFSATLKCDTLPPVRQQPDSGDVALISWDLPHDVESGTISFDGRAEIYGIMLDGKGGVTVDNVALRGSGGLIFSSIAPEVMEEGFREMNTRLVILQFGGNAMPGIRSGKGISAYVRKMVREFEYFKKVAPHTRIMFIGPADMSKSVDGKRVTWPLLPQLNDSLRVKCLENGVAYWDTFKVMGGSGSMNQWVNHNPALAGPDHIHFTYRGAEEIGKAMSRSFLAYYDFYKLRASIPEDAVKNFMAPDSLTAANDSLSINKDAP